MFDINAVEKEAKAEIAKDRAEAAKKKIKAKLRDIAAVKADRLLDKSAQLRAEGQRAADARAKIAGLLG